MTAISPFFCADCGSPTTGESMASCPKCGGRQQIANMSVDLKGSSRMLIGYQLKKSGVKKSIVEFVHRLETQFSSGRKVEKTRLIDRQGNKYREKVVDDETRQTIHLCDEPLDVHRGHGSAKKKHG